MADPLELLVGIDVGTTRVKALAVSLDGRGRGESEAPTPWHHEGACADIDSDDLARLAMTVADRCLDDARIPASSAVRGIGVTGMAEAGALLDAQGRPCAPRPIITPSTWLRWVAASSKVLIPPLISTWRAGRSAFKR